MNLKFSPRGATTEANKMIPPELQLQLFRLVDSQIELGLKMDDWQFFDLHRLDATESVSFIGNVTQPGMKSMFWKVSPCRLANLKPGFFITII